MIKRFTSIEEIHQLTTEDIFQPSITILGVGGAGSNVVNNMIGMDLSGVRFVVSNTDMQALEECICPNKLQLGPKVTKGLGAGSRPEIGFQASEESRDDIKDILVGTNMLFITAGMGGGTGTGASQVIAKIAKDMGILTIGFVTKPFNYEGYHKMEIAEHGLKEIENYLDALVVISNQNLFKVIDEKTSFMDAYKVVDHVLYSGVKAITDLIISKGLVNLDFNDIKTVMEGAGQAMIGSAEAEGEDRAKKVVAQVVNNPLLDGVNLSGAKRILINITAGYNMTLYEVDQIVNNIRQEVDPQAFISFGAIFDEKMADKIRVSIVATGVESKKPIQQESSLIKQIFHKEDKRQKQEIIQQENKTFSQTRAKDSNPVSQYRTTPIQNKTKDLVREDTAVEYTHKELNHREFNYDVEVDSPKYTAIKPEQQILVEEQFEEQYYEKQRVTEENFKESQDTVIATKDVVQINSFRDANGNFNNVKTKEVQSKISIEASPRNYKKLTHEVVSHEVVNKKNLQYKKAYYQDKDIFGEEVENIGKKKLSLFDLVISKKKQSLANQHKMNEEHIDIPEDDLIVMHKRNNISQDKINTSSVKAKTDLLDIFKKK